MIFSVEKDLALLRFVRDALDRAAKARSEEAGYYIPPALVPTPEPLPIPEAPWTPSFVEGTKIRRLRKAKGLRAEDLARAACISQSYWSKIENGTNCGVAPQVIARIAKALGVTVAEISEEPIHANAAG
jgi:DNA-binding Xre family transcriptional regulator